MNASNDEARALPAKQQRAIARCMRRIVAWHEALPDQDRKPFYTSATIVAGTGLTAGQAGPALRALGWQHAQRRMAERDGLPVSVWAPPHEPHPRRRPGRPAPTNTSASGAHMEGTNA